MPHVAIQKAEIYYKIQGSGKPLVLIAGYSCDHTFWDLMVNDLSKHYMVIRFDNRGIGQSHDEGLPFTLDTLAEDLRQLIQALQLSKPIILGQSMGGGIAQLYAQKYPHEISQLILLNTADHLNPRTLMAIDSLLQLYKAQVNFEMLIDTSMPWFFSSAYLSNPQNIQYYKKMLLQNPFPPSPELLARQLQALRLFDSHQHLSHITSPTLVISSESDIICLPEESAKLAKAIPNTTLVSIPSGHSSPVEVPTQVSQVILEFLLKRDGKQ